jgi:hypothetical protein
MRRDLSALLQRARRAQHCLLLPPPLRACSSAAGPSERVVRSLADASGDAISELDLSGSGGAPHADLVCVNIMCEHVGGVCICRLSRVLERPSFAGLRTLRLAGNGCAAALACARRPRELSPHACHRARSLTALPPSVWKLRKLRVLDVRNNRLGAIPAEGLAQLQLDELDTTGNPVHVGTRERTAA